jgi:hypothetical protein
MEKSAIFFEDADDNNKALTHGKKQASAYIFYCLQQLVYHSAQAAI